MEEGQAVWILLGLERGLVHQSTDGKVSQEQAIELLADQVGSLAAQHNLGTAQVSFQFVQSGFNFPPLVIESRHLLRWCFFMIQNARC
jgi:hypothetical protein